MYIWRTQSKYDLGKHILASHSLDVLFIIALVHLIDISKRNEGRINFFSLG